MKQFLAFILAMEILSGNQFVGEVFHTPYLLEHYQFHRTQDASLGFGAFLWEHYLDGQHDRTASSAHHSQHQKMPFQHGHMSMAEVVVVQPSSFAILAYTLDIELLHSIFQEKTSPLSDFSACIFRPPIS